MVLHAIWDNARNQFHLWGEAASALGKVKSPHGDKGVPSRSGKKKTSKVPANSKAQGTHPFAIPIATLRLLVEEIFPGQSISLVEPGTLLAHLPTINNVPEGSPELLLYGNGAASEDHKLPENLDETKEADGTEIAGEVEDAREQGRKNPSAQNTPAKKPQHSPKKGKIPSKKDRPIPEAKAPSEEKKQFGNWILPTIAIPASYLLQDFVSLIKKKQVFLSPDLICGNSLQMWMDAAKIALECIVSQNFLPTIVSEDKLRPGSLAGRWQALLVPEIHEKISGLAQNIPYASQCSGLAEETQSSASDQVVLDFINFAIDGFIRKSLVDTDLGMLPAQKNRRKRADRAAENWYQKLYSQDPYLDLEEPEISSLSLMLNKWLEPVQVTHTGDAFRTCFKLIPPEETSENKHAWILSFNLQARSDPSLLVPAPLVWKEKSRVLTFLKCQFENPQERLLEDLGRSARLFPPIEKSLELAHPTEACLSTKQAYSFLRETTPLLQQTGLGVIVPSWWQKPQGRLGISLTVRQKSGGKVGLGILGLRSIVEYDWQIAVGGELLSQKEFETLVKLKAPLIQVRGQWVELHPAEIEKAIGFLKQMQSHKQAGDAKTRGQEMTLLEAIQLGLGQKTSEMGLAINKINAEGDLQTLFDTFVGGTGKIAPIDPPASFIGRLRPYQVTGVAWLRFLTQYGFGACLADDMGLGKTIEVIAYLLHEQNLRPVPETETNSNKNARKGSAKESSGRAQGQKSENRTKQRSRGRQSEQCETNPSLIICPMSVVGNWRKELSKFAPSLKTFIHHGNERPSGGAFHEQIKNYDVVITTYAITLRDRDMLQQVRWRHLILDEAQNIKNFYAKQTQAIRSLECAGKIALTGTPVENRLTELWSILDFLNPGYLGGQDTFSKQFVVPIEKHRDPERTELLQKIVQPFILRRLKTDKKIIKDLPKKMEFDVYCNLTQEQASLYEAIVQDMLEQINRAEGIRRKGLVLASLVKLKQVCNHPALYLHDGSQVEKRSGKLQRLEEIVRDILDAGEKVLIFTQFSEMGQLLKNYLQRTLQVEVLFLYGQTSQKQRELMVERFQQEAHGAAIFIISLKAGGLGLNLTAANHVIHFDRWWNPAVENQATDRAFRIGQTKNVQVHKFICGGTVEDKIAEMIEKKKDLADKIVGQGEAWVTELTTSQLKEIFTLTREAVITA